MAYNPDIHNRHSIRMKGYDYSQDGFYFITICVEGRENRFGDIEAGNMYLNDAGKIIEKCWQDLANRYTEIRLDEYVVMPNHFHGIVEICRDTPCAYPAPETGQPQGLSLRGKTIGDIIGGFKSITTHQYIKNMKTGIFPPFEKRLWQHNYWEHIIRTETSLFQIQQYIQNNPKNWESDTLH